MKFEWAWGAFIECMMVLNFLLKPYLPYIQLHLKTSIRFHGKSNFLFHPTSQTNQNTLINRPFQHFRTTKPMQNSNSLPNKDHINISAVSHNVPFRIRFDDRRSVNSPPYTMETHTSFERWKKSKGLTSWTDDQISLTERAQKLPFTSAIR